MLKQRLLSSFGVWGSILFVLCAFKLIGVVFLIATFCIGAQYELSKLVQSDKHQALFDTVLSGLFIPLFYFAETKSSFPSDLLYAFALILICNWSVFVGKTARSFLTSLFGFWYVTINLHFFLKILGLLNWECLSGLLVIIWIVLVTKLTDVGGFFVGCAIGKHHLAPTVSPKKTWEGVAGGMAYALIGNSIFYLLFSHCLPFTFGKSLIFTLIMAWGSIVSDLLESLIKRQLKTKDSGSILPGIGGILDLIDSLLLNTPLAYVLLKCFL